MSSSKPEVYENRFTGGDTSFKGFNEFLHALLIYLGRSR
jgi:hypothetical protein